MACGSCHGSGLVPGRRSSGHVGGGRGGRGLGACLSKRARAAFAALASPQGTCQPGRFPTGRSWQPCAKRWQNRWQIHDTSPGNFRGTARPSGNQTQKSGRQAHRCQTDGKPMANQWPTMAQPCQSDRWEVDGKPTHRWRIDGKSMANRLPTDGKLMANRLQIYCKSIAKRWPIGGCTPTATAMANRWQTTCEAIANTLQMEVNIANRWQTDGKPMAN